MTFSTTRRAAIAALTAAGALWAPAAAPAAEQFYAITQDDRLISFQSDSPNALRSERPISGVAAGERLIGLDVRPATDQLYALGSQGRLYVVNRTTARVRAIADPFSPAPVGSSFGFDFNPTVDRIRLVSEEDQNLRLNPDTGTTAAVDTNLAYAAGDASAARNPNVTAAAYTNSVAGATSTVLYGIDTAADALVRQDPPNTGTLDTVGALGVDAQDPVAFDIAADNVGWALFKDPAANLSNLHRIDLASGRAAPVTNPRVSLSERAVRAFAAVGPVDDDRTSPAFSIASSSTQLRSRLLDQGLRLTVACNESCRATARLTTANNQTEGSTRGVVEVAGRERLTIRLDAEARVRLRGGSVRYTLRVDIVDGAGNAVRETRFIRSRNG